MMRLALVLVVGQGQIWNTATALQRLMMQARQNRACIRCQLSLDLSSANTLHYIEEWQSEHDLRDQLQSERFHHMIALMETATEPPQFSLQLIARSFGIEYVEDAVRFRRS